MAERVEAGQVEQVELIEQAEQVEVSASAERVIFAVALVLADQLLDLQNSCLPFHFDSLVVLVEQVEAVV